MGRVDEALRRAAERAEASAAGVGDELRLRPAAVGLDPAEVADEPFAEEAESADAAHPEAGGAPLARANGAEAADPAVFDHVDARLAQKIVVDDRMLAASREQYRRLAAALHHAQAASGLRVVMIASAVASEGKTLTASNLALTLSESYRRRVLLIDADLRRPSLHTVFQVPATPGLSEGLMATGSETLQLHQVTPRLMLLAAGTPSSDPMAGLISPRMQQFVDEAKAAFEWVIVDTPPVGLLTDANLLAAMVDGILMVVKAGSTPCDLVKRAVDAVGSHRLLGVVLNRALPSTQAYGYEEYQKYYSQVPATRAGR